MVEVELAWHWNTESLQYTARSFCHSFVTARAGASWRQSAHPRLNLAYFGASRRQLATSQWLCKQEVTGSIPVGSIGSTKAAPISCGSPGFAVPEGCARMCARTPSERLRFKGPGPPPATPYPSRPIGGGPNKVASRTPLWCYRDSVAAPTPPPPAAAAPAVAGPRSGDREFESRRPRLVYLQ